MASFATTSSSTPVHLCGAALLRARGGAKSKRDEVRAAVKISWLKFGATTMFASRSGRCFIWWRRWPRFGRGTALVVEAGDLLDDKRLFLKINEMLFHGGGGRRNIRQRQLEINLYS